MTIDIDSWGTVRSDDFFTDQMTHFRDESYPWLTRIKTQLSRQMNFGRFWQGIDAINDFIKCDYGFMKRIKTFNHDSLSIVDRGLNDFKLDNQIIERWIKGNRSEDKDWEDISILGGYCISAKNRFALILSCFDGEKIHFAWSTTYLSIIACTGWIAKSSG